MFRTKISYKIDKNATKSQKLVKTGNSGFRIWQPCSSEKYDKASFGVLVHTNLNLAIQIMFRTKIEKKTILKQQKLVKIATLFSTSLNPAHRKSLKKLPLNS